MVWIQALGAKIKQKHRCSIRSNEAWLISNPHASLSVDVNPLLIPTSLQVQKSTHHVIDMCRPWSSPMRYRGNRKLTRSMYGLC